MIPYRNYSDRQLLDARVIGYMTCPMNTPHCQRVHLNRTVLVLKCDGITRLQTQKLSHSAILAAS